MTLLPKIGTLEAMALAALLVNEDGITHLDFPEGHPLNDEKKLHEVINNLINGMYESEQDSQLKFDA